MKEQIELLENCAIVKLSGQYVGGEETDVLFDKVGEILKSGTVNLVMDFGEVTYFSSIVIGMLIRHSRDFLAANGKIVICNLNKVLEDIFIMTKLTTLIDVAEDAEAAIKAFEK